MDEPIGTAQVAAADFLVLSKVDLVAADALAAVRSRTRGTRVPGRGPRRSARAGRARSALRRRPAPPGRSDTGASPDLDLEAVAWTSDRPLDRTRLLALLGALPGAVYRAKGVVRFAGASVPAVVDVVAGRVGLQWEPALPLGDPSRLVFIGRNQKSWWEAPFGGPQPPLRAKYFLPPEFPTGKIGFILDRISHKCPESRYTPTGV